jgi:tartrate-resistant acid phosphatase type 5
MSEKRSHFEEYIYLAGLTHNAAFIGWGGFEFEVKGDPDDEWAIADDLVHHPQRRGAIGVNAPPLAQEGTAARIEVTNKNTGEVKTQHQIGANRFHVRELDPDTEYTYRILVKLEREEDFREWGAGPLRDWDVEGGKRGLRLVGNSYQNEFHTFPDPKQPASDLTFAVIGDFGRGVRKEPSEKQTQRDIADALEHTVLNQGVRFILTTGDNIYHGGSNDDDWFYTYFQPYRYVINRVPVYPSVGNHDDGEDENNDDRAQLYDNFFIVPRFTNFKDVRESSTDPGLFYRFRYGSDIEFVCLDTSKRSRFFSKRYFKRDEHQEFIKHAFSTEDKPKWRIPFSHHPPYSAGPQHLNTDSMIEFFIESGRFKDAGVRAIFSGHEHNFQHSVEDDIHYFVTGGAGEIRTNTPSMENFIKAKTQAWGGNDEGHFLLVKIDAEQMEVTALAKRAPGGEPRVLKVKDIHGQHLDDYLPIKI